MYKYGVKTNSRDGDLISWVESEAEAHLVKSLVDFMVDLEPEDIILPGVETVVIRRLIGTDEIEVVRD